MNKKLILTLLATLTAGAVMFGTGVFIGNESKDKNENIHSESNAEDVVSEENEDAVTNNKEMNSFENIYIRVLSGDVSIEYGDEYSLKYYLHGREKVKRFEVMDNTLYFDTGFESRYRPAYGDWKVTVTIPEDAVLKNIDIKTAAGDITISDKIFDEGNFETAAGKIEFTDITANEIEMKSVSDEIKIRNSKISDIEAETVSSDINVSGTFGEVDMKSVSGDITVDGEFTSADIENVSGDIKMTASVSSADAKTVSGRVVINGESRGRKVNISGGNPYAKVKTVSGDITIG